MGFVRPALNAILLLAAMEASSAHAESRPVELTPASGAIDSLAIESASVRDTAPGKGTLAIRFKYTGEQSILVCQEALASCVTAHAPRSPGGPRESFLPIALDEHELSVMTVAPLGAVERAEFQFDARAASERKAWHFSIETRVSFLSFSQESLGTLHETALTPEASLILQPTPRWSLDGRIAIDAITRASDDVAGTYRNLHVEGAIGYDVIGTSSSAWEVPVRGGISYDTLIVPSADFGFRAAAGPLVSAGLKRRLSSERAVFGELAWVPILSGSWKGFSESDNRFGARAGVVFGSWSLRLDYSIVALEGSEDKPRSRSIGIGASYAL